MQTQNESEAPVAPDNGLIGGMFQVNLDRPLPGLGGGAPAFAVTDRRAGRPALVAIQARPDAPPRAQLLTMLGSSPIDGIMSPLGHGRATGPDGRDAWFVVCFAPPGPAVWESPMQGPAWTEAELLACLLRPAATALARLQARHATHRAIRPDNLFRIGPGEAVTLGAAWAAPPGFLQPAVFESPAMAACIAAGRGDGNIADDVYALGVVLLSLALGRVPLAGMDDAEVVRRKLELGSYAALVGEERLPGTIADIVRGMLAEDPEHRPPPQLLADPAAARARRVAARPPARAQTPMETTSGPVWNARMLAHAMGRDTEQALRLLRSGAADRWLRRSLGDAVVATRLDEARRGRDAEDATGEALLLTRAIAALDPLAPMCWQGISLWPDALGPVLAARDDAVLRAMHEMVDAEATAAWGAMRPERVEPGMLRSEAHQWRAILRTRGPAGGLRRLRYALNPLLGCASQALGNRLVVKPGEVLPALEAATATDGLPIDPELAAFLGARQDRATDSDLAQLAGERPAVAQLRVLAGLQRRQSARHVRLAARLLPHLSAALDVWRSRQRREAMRAELDEAARLGDLSALLALIEDPAEREADSRGAAAAEARAAEIDAALQALAGRDGERTATARRLGQELVLACALCGLTVATIAAVAG